MAHEFNCKTWASKTFLAMGGFMEAGCPCPRVFLKSSCQHHNLIQFIYIGLCGSPLVALNNAPTNSLGIKKQCKAMDPFQHTVT